MRYSVVDPELKAARLAARIEALSTHLRIASGYDIDLYRELWQLCLEHERLLQGMVPEVIDEFDLFDAPIGREALDELDQGQDTQPDPPLRITERVRASAASRSRSPRTRR